ncbi:hypothetical protein FQR65_LT09105 [Abscondita terminalis]|nr:hypothetical protein FQR65_LT09105 [Abscondita terminalis]
MEDWVGTKLEDIYYGQGPWSFTVPSITASRYHSVLYQLPATLKAPPKPHINIQNNHWDNDHVHMPYSSKNVFLVKDRNGSDVPKKKWEIIQEALLQPINSVQELQSAISKYNTHLPKFLALHHFFEEVLEEEEADEFFNNMLPGIIRLALRLPQILPGNLPLLKKGTSKSISLSQLQISSLLANAFLCTFPCPNVTTYPDIHFARLFSAHLRPDMDNVIVEKFKCICHYFARVLNSEPVGVVTFERKYFSKSQLPRWDKLDTNLGNTRIHISNTGVIEDDGNGLLQVDFANKYIGGGVLGFGCVQEEIRFLICPELLISRLFTEQLGPTEALVITGVERYSKYKGYGDSFAWGGNYSDNTPYDNYGRRRTSIVAIDALFFGNPIDQYNSSCILRELNKAFVGFHSRLECQLPGVATGNWGCGAFRGDPNLKSLIQLMACSGARRDLVYFTFGDIDLRDKIYEMYLFLATNQITVCQLWRYLCQFCTTNVKSRHLFSFIQQAHFDSKNQLSIKDFFCFNKKKSDKANASTSNGNSHKTTSDKSDIIVADEELNEIIIESSQSQSVEDNELDIIESSQNEELQVSLSMISQQINTVSYSELKNIDIERSHVTRDNEASEKSSVEQNSSETTIIDKSQCNMDVNEVVENFELRNDDLYYGHGPWGFKIQNVQDEENFVKMPFSASLGYCSTTKRHWDLIKEALSDHIRKSAELENAIKKYCKSFEDFLALHYFLDEFLDSDQNQHFFSFTLPGIIKLALKLPELLPQDVYILSQKKVSSITLSQIQIASLLANAFLSTFPCKSSLCPGINFSRLFSSHSRIKRIKCVSEKLKSICHYFDRIIRKEPNGIVSFERKVVTDNNLPAWENHNRNLGETKVLIKSVGLIEDDGDGFLQVDFANKNVGGGVLAYGCVQEEIRFIICPELIVGRLFTEQLGETEALIVTGAERYSSYSGYGDTYEWREDYIDNTPFDPFGRRRSAIVVIDATKFRKSVDQYKMTNMLRELNKAYSGFYSNFKHRLQPVATGNWGCGAYKGDPKLKFLLQLMACNVSNRDMVYFTFNNEELAVQLKEMYKFLAKNKITTAQLWEYLEWFSLTKLKLDHLYTFIYHIHFNKDEIIKENLSNYTSKNFKKQTEMHQKRNKVPNSVDLSEEIDNDLSSLFTTIL